MLNELIIIWIPVVITLVVGIGVPTLFARHAELRWERLSRDSNQKFEAFSNACYELKQDMVGLKQDWVTYQKELNKENQEFKISMREESERFKISMREESERFQISMREENERFRKEMKEDFNEIKRDFNEIKELIRSKLC